AAARGHPRDRRSPAAPSAWRSGPKRSLVPRSTPVAASSRIPAACLRQARATNPLAPAAASLTSRARAPAVAARSRPVPEQTDLTETTACRQPPEGPRPPAQAVQARGRSHPCAARSRFAGPRGSGVAKRPVRVPLAAPSEPQESVAQSPRAPPGAATLRPREAAAQAPAAERAEEPRTAPVARRG